MGVNNRQIVHLVANYLFAHDIVIYGIVDIIDYNDTIEVSFISTEDKEYTYSVIVTEDGFEDGGFK